MRIFSFARSRQGRLPCCPLHLCLFSFQQIDCETGVYFRGDKILLTCSPHWPWVPQSKNQCPLSLFLSVSLWNGRQRSLFFKVACVFRGGKGDGHGGRGGREKLQCQSRGLSEQIDAEIEAGWIAKARTECNSLIEAHYSKSAGVHLLSVLSREPNQTTMQGSCFIKCLM